MNSLYLLSGFVVGAIAGPIDAGSLLGIGVGYPALDNAPPYFLPPLLPCQRVRGSRPLIAL